MLSEDTKLILGTPRKHRFGTIFGMQPGTKNADAVFVWMEDDIDGPVNRGKCLRFSDTLGDVTGNDRVPGPKSLCGGLFPFHGIIDKESATFKRAVRYCKENAIPAYVWTVREEIPLSSFMV